ncbi:uncharacterized protein J3R85_014539 [Psidium guajava]|nr:uncharacterized protein J3R85_014539 [Psidium guajava]
MALAKRFPSEAEEDPWEAQSGGVVTWASSILLAIIILTVLWVSIIWLTVIPRQLAYTVQDALVSNFNITSGRLITADFSISVFAENPNHRVSFYYDSMKVFLKSHGHTLASSDGPRFDQGKHTYTIVPLSLTSHDVVLPESMSSHLMEQKRLGSIEIDMIIKARVKFKARHWKQDRCTIRIFCTKMAAHFSRVEPFNDTICAVEL